MAKMLLDQHIRKLVAFCICDKNVADSFLQRSNQGNLTRDENPKSHVCVYFGAVSSKTYEVFIGHHKKSGLWLFTGGHVDESETLEESLEREIEEEWGLVMSALDIGDPLLLTQTIIDNSPKQPCKVHYDVWYFVEVSRDSFKPDTLKLAKEFHETKWVSLDKARKIVTDPNTLTALTVIEKKFFSEALL